MINRLKYYSSRTSLVLLVVILGAFTSPFKPIDTSLKEVKIVFDKMNELGTNGKTCYLNYQVKALLNEKDKQGNNIVSSSKIEMMTAAKNSWLFSDKMNIYRDQKTTITVLPTQKVIYLADAVVGKKEERLYDKLSVLQDSIFKCAEKVETLEVKNKPFNKVVTLYLNPKMSQFLELKKVVYCINTTSNTLHKVDLEYMPDKQYKTLEYVFTNMDYDYKKTNISVPVTTLFFEKKNKLKAEYTGYKVIDNRKK
ncbi:MAG: hypothetical protein Q8M29_14440 [Bacteroidota bacterium]|nr:hypothetical protein [Bacteroidota bacterium]